MIGSQRLGARFGFIDGRADAVEADLIDPAMFLPRADRS